jgi:hypothetical protein
MKPFLFTCLWFFASIFASAQQIVHVDKDDYNASSFFSSISGEPVLRARFVKLVEGTPFFKDEWLPSIIITPQGRQYNNIKVKLDLMDGRLYYTDSAGNEFIALSPIKEVVLVDATNNQKFRFLSSFGLRMLKEGWYVPLVEEGKARLFKFFDKDVREDKPYGSAVTEQKIVTREKYVLVYKDLPVNIKSEKDLPAALGDQQLALESFIKSQNKKLPLKDRLVAAVNYYNTLVVK